MDGLKLLESCVEHRLLCIRRVRYVVGASVHSDAGPLELVFEGLNPILLDAAGDGECLSVRSGPWADPFAEPLSDENREFVAKCGKWTAFTIDQHDALGQLLDLTLDRVDSKRGYEGRRWGAQLSFGTLVLDVTVAADELHVAMA